MALSPIKPSDFEGCIVAPDDSLGMAFYKRMKFMVLRYLWFRSISDDYGYFSCNQKKMVCAALAGCGKGDFYACDEDVVVPPAQDTNCRQPTITAVKKTGADKIWAEVRWVLPSSTYINVSLMRMDADSGTIKETDITNERQPYTDATIEAGHTYRYWIRLYCSFNSQNGQYTFTDSGVNQINP